MPCEIKIDTQIGPISNALKLMDGGNKIKITTYLFIGLQRFISSSSSKENDFTSLLITSTTTDILKISVYKVSAFAF